MKKLLLLLLLLCFVTTLSAQGDQHSCCNKVYHRVEQIGGYYYPSFRRHESCNHALIIHYRVHFYSNRTSESRMASIISSMDTDRGPGYSESCRIEILSVRCSGSSQYSGDTDTGGGSTGGRGLPQPPSSEIYLATGLGTGVSYGGAFGLKASFHFYFLGVTCGLSVAPSYGMPRSFSWGFQLNLYDCYIDLQIVKDGYIALLWGTNNINLYKNIYLNLGLGLGGYTPNKFIFEIGVGIKFGSGDPYR